MIDPDSATVVAPAVSLSAGRSAALTHENCGSLNIALAVVTMAVLRRARELHSLFAPTIAVAVPVTIMVAVVVSVVVAVALVVVTIPVPGVIHLTSVHDEVGAAAVIDPYTSLVESPTRALHAR